MGSSHPEPAKDIEFNSLTLVTLKNGKFQIDPEISDFYRQTMGLNTDYKVAIISAVGPPGSGKTTLLRDAMYSLIPKKELDKVRIVKYNPAKQFTDPRLLLITSSVSLRDKNSKLVVFGLDIDAGDYNRKVYDKLIDFAIAISSITLVSLSVRFDPSFWDCEQTFLKVLQGPRLQTAGIVIFQENSSPPDREPFGLSELSDYLQREDVHPETKKAVQIISSSFNHVKLASLPIPIPPAHYAPGSWHHLFFSSLFSTMEPVKRYPAPWDFAALQKYVSRMCQTQPEPMSHPSTKSAPTLYLQTPVASTSEPQPRPRLTRLTSRTYHDESAYLTAYDAKFQSKQKTFLSASNPFLTLRQLERIHQEITAELWTYFETHGGPYSLENLLANCFQSYSEKRIELEQFSIKVSNEFQSAFFECKYQLSLQLLNPTMEWDEFLSKVNYSLTNVLEKKRSAPTDSSPFLLPYFQSISKNFYSDVCLLIDMIQFFQTSVTSFSNRNICFPESEILCTIERIRADTFKQGTFSPAGNADFPKVIDNFIDNQFTKMSHINKGRTSLEKHLIAVAIEKVCAKFHTTLSTYTSNRILTDYQLIKLRDQLLPAAESAFLLKRSARGFKFPTIWEASKSQLQAELVKQFQKIQIQNQQKLQKKLKEGPKPSKQPLPISLSPPNPNQSALPTTAHALIQEGATNFSSTPVQTPPSSPRNSHSSDFCIHIKESEFTFSWTNSSKIHVKILPPLLSITNGLAISEASPPSHPSDSQVFNIFELLSHGLPTDQVSPSSAKLPNPQFNYAEEIIALFFRQAVSSIPELERCQRRCVVITSAATLPDARARLKSSTALAGFHLVRILNPTTALGLSYYNNFLDHPKLPQDHHLFLLISEDGKFEIQLAQLTAKSIVTSNAKIILPRNSGGTLKDFYQLIFEHYFPSTTYHNPEIIDITVTSPALLLQNSTIQILPKDTASALYRGTLAWMSSEPGGHDDLQIIQSLAVSVQVSLLCNSSEHQNIWLNSPQDGNPLWLETELHPYDHIIFLYQHSLGFPPAIPISQPKKLKITLPDSDPAISRKLKAALDLNGCLDLQVCTGSMDDSSHQLLKTLHFENFMPPNAISTIQLQLTSNIPPQVPSFPSNSNDFASGTCPSPPLGPPPPIPDTPAPESPLQTTTTKAFQSPHQELEALILELQARLSKATLSRAAKKLLEKRIEDANSRLNSPDNTSQQIQAALRSLQATAKAFDDSDDSE